MVNNELDFRTQFPALRCVMGDWTYYVTFMKFSDVDYWIKKTRDIHKSEGLRDMIQRELKPRANAIADYLIKQPERFFNTIVVGVNGGAPRWHPIRISASSSSGDLKLDADAEKSVGVLELQGNEGLFAIDGQHRVEAIKEALKRDKSLETDDLSVIFVAHKRDQKGLQRTRRLFTTLNRYAKPITKSEGIALDEDDAYAIVTRTLVEEFDLLDGYVHFGGTAALPASDKNHLTSIITIYDMAEAISIRDIKKRQQIKKQVRPGDQFLKELFDEQVRYWMLLKTNIPEYRQLFASKPSRAIAGKYRDAVGGGHLMFRPAGQLAFTKASRILMNRGFEMKLVVESLAQVPMDLNQVPWREYNAALVKRGSFMVWIDEAAISGWLNEQHHGRRGASCTYSDTAITAALLLKAVYRLPLRATQGLLASLLKVLQIPLPTPHYSTLSRRQANLKVIVPIRGREEGIHLVVDSTGCKVYGEGEWKVRQYGYSYRRTWRKLHLGVDEQSGEIVAVTLSSNNVCDGEVLVDLLQQVEAPIAQVTGDGSYDQRQCYEALSDYQELQGKPLRVTIPPQKGAAIWQSKRGTSRGTSNSSPRNENLHRMREIGRRQWKQESGYHRRSLAECAMYRYKTLIGDKLQARKLERQAREAFIGCVALNRMTHLGMPESYVVS